MACERMGGGQAREYGRVVYIVLCFAVTLLTATPRGSMATVGARPWNGSMLVWTAASSSSSTSSGGCPGCARVGLALSVMMASRWFRRGPCARNGCVHCTARFSLLPQGQASGRHRLTGSLCTSLPGPVPRARGRLVRGCPHRRVLLLQEGPMRGPAVLFGHTPSHRLQRPQGGRVALPASAKVPAAHMPLARWPLMEAMQK